MPHEFCEEFGATPPMCAYLWKLMRRKLPNSSEPVHLLWTLWYARHYPTWKDFVKAMGHHHSTLRVHIRPIMKIFPRIMSRVIRWEDRLRKDKGRTCKTYEDGIDFGIRNPKKRFRNLDPHLPFDRMWYSYKIDGAGLRYGVVTCIQTGWIVAINGPFPPKDWPDIKIFRARTKPRLAPGEMIEADKGYRGDSRTRMPFDYCCMSEKRAKKRLASRHEATNRRLRQFQCLNQTFRHDHKQHKEFMAIAATCTALYIQWYGPPFDVSY